MTAPAAQRRPLPQMAPASVVLDAFRQEARERHEAWYQHAYFECQRCLSGLTCRYGDLLCDLADAAGLRVERAEQIEATRRDRSARQSADEEVTRRQRRHGGRAGSIAQSSETSGCAPRPAASAAATNDKAASRL